MALIRTILEEENDFTEDKSKIIDMNKLISTPKDLEP
jgi:hypothetical protein